MQLIFKYDIERLLSYSNNPINNIHIVDEKAYMMLSFPDVEYFNYTFTLDNHPLSKGQVNNIKSYYENRQVDKHKIIVNANCGESNSLLSQAIGYNHTATIAKTALGAEPESRSTIVNELRFIEADDRNIDHFTRLYLAGFDSDKQADDKIVSNFKHLLKIKDLNLFLIENEGKYVGVNLLYQSATESLLAGGAIVPEHRNKGFHQQSLKFRIDRALKEQSSKQVIAWAYSPSISLRNMLKLNMKVKETFNVYEYSR